MNPLSVITTAGYVCHMWRLPAVPFPGVGDDPLDRRGIGADDRHDAAGCNHIAESNVDKLHFPLLFHILHLLTELFDLRLQVHTTLASSASLHLEPMVLASRLSS